MNILDGNIFACLKVCSSLWKKLFILWCLRELSVFMLYHILILILT